MSNVIPFSHPRAVFIWPSVRGIAVGISTTPGDPTRPAADAEQFDDFGIGFDHALYLGEKSGLPIVSLREGF